MAVNEKHLIDIRSSNVTFLVGISKKNPGDLRGSHQIFVYETKMTPVGHDNVIDHLDIE